VETLVYLVILGLLIFIVANLLLVMVRSFYAGQLERELVQSATGSLERMVREIRKAHSIDLVNSIFGAHPGKLVLQQIAATNGHVSYVQSFFLNGTTLVIQEGDGQAVALTNPLVRVDNLVFRPLTTPMSEGVKIDLTFSAVRGGVVRSEKFYSTAVLRGSY